MNVGSYLGCLSGSNSASGGGGGGGAVQLCPFSVRLRMYEVVRASCPVGTHWLVLCGLMIVLLRTTKLYVFEFITVAAPLLRLLINLPTATPSRVHDQPSTDQINPINPFDPSLTLQELPVQKS